MAPIPPQTRSNSIPLTNLEARPHSPDREPVEGPPPEYKEEDMSEVLTLSPLQSPATSCLVIDELTLVPLQPLPPYMARVRMVMRQEQPVRVLMPERRYGIAMAIIFLLVIMAIVGVAIGVGVRNNRRNDNGGDN